MLKMTTMPTPLQIQPGKKNMNFYCDFSYKKKLFLSACSKGQ